MALEFKHFDTRLGVWIHEDGNPNNPDSVLRETLDRTLLEEFFPEGGFSFGHMDESSTADDLKNHPNGHVLLFSSKTRLLYGPAEYLERIEQLCPDRKDRGAYGSIFLGSCHHTVKDNLNVLIVDDATGENAGILPKEVAWGLVGDCHGKISPQLSEQLSGTVEHVLQHRLRFGDDRFGKGTVAPKDLTPLPYQQADTPPIDLVLPTSSFKGGDKENQPIQPGLYRQQRVWIGEKERSLGGTIAISQVHASSPEGIKDFLPTLEKQAQDLAALQEDPRLLARLYCERYEKRVLKRSLLEFDLQDNDDAPQTQEQLVYRLIKADLASGQAQLLETQKVKDELTRFVRQEWRDIALGKTIEFSRAMIIPSKALKHGEICDLKFNEGEELLNFRSPYLNSNGMCLSINRHVEDAFAPNGKPLQGVIVVNDEDIARLYSRLSTQVKLAISTQQLEGEQTTALQEFLDRDIASLGTQERVQFVEAFNQQISGLNVSGTLIESLPRETESERQGRDYDGDTIGVERASKYPHFTAEVKFRNLPENAYDPVKKEKKASFVRADGTQPPFEEIALFMSDGISVGVINNHATTTEALESEIDLLKKYGTLSQKAQYVRTIGQHYQGLIQQESHPQRPHRLPASERDRLIAIAQLAAKPELTADEIDAVMDANRQLYHNLIAVAGYQNQLAVDIFKSNRAPDMELIKEHKRLLYREVNYIRDKKDSQAYQSKGIVINGYSPVELIIDQTNQIFQQSQLEARPTVQFTDLFPVNYTSTQKLQATQVKQEFDRLFNAATQQRKRLKTESGLRLQLTTQSGNKIEISNLLPNPHPMVFERQAIALNLRLIPNKQNSASSHQLIALAEVEGVTGEDGKPFYQRLGTVCEHSRIEHQLTAGMITQNATVERLPALTKKQVELMFDSSYEVLEEFRSQTPNEQKVQMAAACWHLGTNRETRTENKLQPKDYKISNFSFEAFPDQVIQQLETLQMTQLKGTGISQPDSNAHYGRVWHPSEKLPIEIKVRQLPPNHPRFGHRLIYVEGKEFAKLEERSAALPIGTKAKAQVIPDPSYTLTAKVEHPRFSGEIQIGKVQQHAYADATFAGEEAVLAVDFVRPEPTTVLKLNGQTIGELDKDSVRLLEQAGRLVAGASFRATLQTLGTGTGAYVLATTQGGNVIRANKQAFFSAKNQRFDRLSATLTVGFKENRLEPAVLKDGQVLGILTQSATKQALQSSGLLSAGQCFTAILTSNSTTVTLKVDPASVRYPEVWTKMSAATGTNLSNSVPLPSQTEELRDRLTQRPTLLFQTQEQLGITIDDRFREVTKSWLFNQSIEVQDVSHSFEVETETTRGYGVLLVPLDRVPSAVRERLFSRFGQPLKADGLYSEYFQKLQTLPEVEPRSVPVNLPNAVGESQPDWGDTPNCVASFSLPSVAPAHIDISKLTPEQVVVFGSNTEGRHGAGVAKQVYGERSPVVGVVGERAVYGQATGYQEGRAGASYAIATKDLKQGVRSVPLEAIAHQIDAFIDFALNNPQKVFLVTKIGCGLGGYKPEEIAPLWQNRAIPANVQLPVEFLASPTPTLNAPTDTALSSLPISPEPISLNSSLRRQIEAQPGTALVHPTHKVFVTSTQGNQLQIEQTQKFAFAHTEWKGESATIEVALASGTPLALIEGKVLGVITPHSFQILQEKVSKANQSVEGFQFQGTLQPGTERPNPLAGLPPLNAAVAQHAAKDVAMAAVATQFIGQSAAPPDTPSSTRHYEKAWGERANTGVYTSEDVVMVSGSGPWRGVSETQIKATFQEHYVPLLTAAIAAGSTFVVGKAAGTDLLVQNYLQEQGYLLVPMPEGYFQASPGLTQTSTPDLRTTSELDGYRLWYRASDLLQKPPEHREFITTVVTGVKAGKTPTQTVSQMMLQDIKAAIAFWCEAAKTLNKPLSYQNRISELLTDLNQQQLPTTNCLEYLSADILAFRATRHQQH